MRGTNARTLLFSITVTFAVAVVCLLSRLVGHSTRHELRDVVYSRRNLDRPTKKRFIHYQSENVRFFELGRTSGLYSESCRFSIKRFLVDLEGFEPSSENKLVTFYMHNFSRSGRRRKMRFKRQRSELDSPTIKARTYLVSLVTSAFLITNILFAKSSAVSPGIHSGIMTIASGRISIFTYPFEFIWIKSPFCSIPQKQSVASYPSAPDPPLSSGLPYAAYRTSILNAIASACDACGS